MIVSRLGKCERLDLENFMLHTPLAKERCRAQALLWLDEGESVEQIAELLHVSRQTIYNWLSRFQERAELDLERFTNGLRTRRIAVGETS